MLALDSAICGQKCGVHGLIVNCSDARPKCDRDWRRCQGTQHQASAIFTRTTAPIHKNHHCNMNVTSMHKAATCCLVNRCSSCRKQGTSKARDPHPTQKE